MKTAPHATAIQPSAAYTFYGNCRETGLLRSVTIVAAGEEAAKAKAGRKLLCPRRV